MSLNKGFAEIMDNKESKLVVSIIRFLMSVHS